MTEYQPNREGTIEREPRHRADPDDLRDGNDAYAQLMSYAEGTSTGRLIERLDREHGDAFRIFLAQPDRPVDPAELERHFLNVYVGHYETLDAFIDAEIEKWGWRRDLESLIADDPLFGLSLTFDREAIAGLLGDHYRVIEADGGVYVFEEL
jgi:hypothetical protein